MKKNLFTAFLAVALVMALVFVVAPNAKAETGADFTFSADGESYEVKGNCVIDLAGFDVSITVAEGVENPNVVVIDSKNLEDMTGNSAGTLAVNGNCNINDVNLNLVDSYRYLRVDNGGTYSFYPFNMAITTAGVHVKANAVSLEVKFVANKVVQDKLTACGLYKHDGANANLFANIEPDYKFEDGKYGLRVCFDLTGSLTTDMLNETRTFSAYVEIDGTPIIGNQRVAVKPADILALVNDGYEASFDEQKTLAKVLFWKNPQVREALSNITDATKIATVSDSYNHANNFQGENGVNKNKQVNGLVLDENISLSGHPNVTVGGTQPCLSIAPDANAQNEIHLTINAAYNISKIDIKIGSLSSALVNLGRKMSCTVVYLGANGEVLDSYATGEFTDSVDLSLTLPEGCRAIKVTDATCLTSNCTWIGVYNFTLYREVEALNCTGHIDKNGAEGGYKCDFCEQTFVPIPDPRSYDYLNNFEGKTLNSNGAATAELDEIISLSTNYANVSANQKCINYSFGINSKAYIGFKSTYDLSEVSLTVGGRNKDGTERPDRSYSCTVVFLDEEGNTLKTESVATFVSTTTVTFSDLPDGCREVRVSADTVTGNTWFGLYGFSCTFTD